ncbi:hypothetical protein GP486_001281 [Trichoglossum hirsutum]|uniref:Uncharacterized protein n=1 Tax=Trichoglossum hirsutum TaxID=265104 RepID=A0A9P8RSS3_9PEZI|nr:hypothetical protein GP486_001281 [Trichoglossum hirsutum]
MTASYLAFCHIFKDNPTNTLTDLVAQGDLWLKQCIHVARHPEIQVTSYHRPLPVRSHLSMVRTIAESQQKSVGKSRLSSLAINLQSAELPLRSAEKQRIPDETCYLLEDQRCPIAQALHIIPGLREFDISGLETMDVKGLKELVERVRERVTGDIVTMSQQDMSFAQRMSAAF